MVIIDHTFMQRLPARAVRRHETAGQSGPGAGARAAVRAARRADHRARRRGAALDPGERPRGCRREQGFAVLFISHDIGTVLDLSDRILVMYAGEIVEEQRGRRLLREPLHPYTKGLLGSYGDPRAETVRITYIPGRPPDLSPPRPAARSRRAARRRSTSAATVDPPLVPDRAGESPATSRAAAPQRRGVADERGRPGAFAGPQFVKSTRTASGRPSDELAAHRRRASARPIAPRRGFSVAEDRGGRRRRRSSCARAG